MNIRVLLVDHAPIFGGAEAFLIDVVRGLTRERYTPHLAIDCASPIARQFQVIATEIHNTPLHLTPMPRLNRHPFFLWNLLWAGWQLAKLLRAKEIDLMHTFTARAHLIGAVAAILSGTPLVWRICDDTVPVWLLRVFSSVPREIISASHWLTTQYPHLPFTGIISDGALPPTAYTQAEARTHLNLPLEALCVVHVGRLVRWKGQAVLIKALANLPNAHGVIVGRWHSEDEVPGPLGGGKAYFAELEALAQPLADRIHFTGFLKEPALAYAAADVVVHTSTAPEPFGRVVIEAMFAERAVIATDAGALPEIIEAGISGYLVPPNDVSALTNAIQRLLTDKILREQLAKHGKQHATEHFSLQVTLDQLVATYDRALIKSKSIS